MKNFEYARASSVDGAIRLSTPESRFLAGGIDLLGEMKEYIVSPRRVIDLKLIPGLDQIPRIGDLFATQSGTKTRTELIIFIRPSVIRDPFDAHRIAEEMRTKLNGDLIGRNYPGIQDGPVVRSR